MPIVSGVQHQMRRGTTSQIATFKGAAGETVFDTSFFRVIGQDGSKLGGYPHNMANVQTVIGGTAAQINNNATVVFVYSTAAPGAVTLPPVGSYLPGQSLIVADGAGIAGTENIVITASGSDTIYTSSGGSTTSVTISVNGRTAQFIANSSSHWTLTSTT